jgi:hypothetical protein
VQAQEIGVGLANACPWIGQYQITQERLDRIVVAVTPEREDLSPDLDAVRARSRSPSDRGSRSRRSSPVISRSSPTERSG